MLDKTLHLGKLESTHGIAPMFMMRAVGVAAISFVFFILMLVGFYIRQNIGYFLLSTAFLIVYLLTMFGWMMARRNVLNVYENGFTFKKQTFLWDEIDAIEGKEMSRLVGGEKLNFEVRKTSGERIVLTDSIEGAQKIIERVFDEIDKRGEDEQIS